MQIADFVLGFAGIDIARDDGRRLGLWPWEDEARRPSRAAVWLRRSVFGESSREATAVVLHSPAREPEPEPAPPKPVTPKPEPPRAAPAPVAPRRAHGPARAASKVSFCVQCFGRHYPPEAVAAARAKGGSPGDYLSEADKAWPGRWCECWKSRGDRAATSSKETAGNH